MALVALTFFAAMLLTVPGKAAAAASQDDDDDDDGPGIIYYGRDAEGNRIFGTDHKSGARFYTVPETGERRFVSAPPDPSASGSSIGTEYIFISPEIHPDYYTPEGRPSHSVRPPQAGLPGKPGNRPGDRPGKIGEKPSKPGVRPDKPGQKPGSEKPLLRPEDRPPPGGPASIPQRGGWRQYGKHPAYDRPPTSGPSFHRRR